MDVAIMIEGQNGLTWPRWQRIARAVEDLGFAGLYRSDHVTNAEPPDIDSLELWVSLTWLASHTTRIAFGPLVAPFSMRHPVTMARTAAAVDDLSGGRLQLGLGAGWQQREHTNYGYDLLEVPERLARFAEGVEVVTRLLRIDAPVSYAGTYYRLRDAILLPRPQRPGGPPIVVGGGRAVFPIVARHADEWNVPFIPVDRFAALNARLDQEVLAAGRQPAAVRRSLMTRVIFGRDDREAARKVEATGRTAEQLQAAGIIAGTGPQIVERLGRLAEAGAQRVMLQWIELDDLDGLEGLARAVLAHL